MPDHSASTDERASLAQPSQSSSPLECISHLGFNLVPFPLEYALYRLNMPYTGYLFHLLVIPAQAGAYVTTLPRDLSLGARDTDLLHDERVVHP